MVLQGAGVDTGAAACPVSIVYCWLNRELLLERECLCLLEACEGRTLHASNCRCRYKRLWPAFVKLTETLKAINVLELYAGVTLGLLPDKEP